MVCAVEIPPCFHLFKINSVLCSPFVHRIFVIFDSRKPVWMYTGGIFPTERIRQYNNYKTRTNLKIRYKVVIWKYGFGVHLRQFKDKAQNFSKQLDWYYVITALSFESQRKKFSEVIFRGLRINWLHSSSINHKQNPSPLDVCTYMYTRFMT